MRVTASNLARLIFRRSPLSVEVGPTDLTLARVGGDLKLSRDQVRSVSGKSGWLWDTLRVEPSSGGAIMMRGLPKGTAMTASLLWQAWGLAPLAGQVTRAFRALLDRDAYFNRTALAEWRGLAAGLGRSMPAAFDGLPLPAEVGRDLADCRSYLADAEQLVFTRNDTFVRRKMQEHAAWFAAAGAQYGLTTEQQEAILRDEDNTLVVAGAGTGKTSAVAGKVGYLLRTDAARPEQILLLSFTRKAATEMAERLATVLGPDVASAVQTSTFHGLGVEIVAQAAGFRPSVSRLAEDPVALRRAITGYLQALFEDPASRQEMLEFFAYFRFPYRSPFEFETAHEHHQYVLGHELRTMKGELVKSHEELLIANWLFLNGVAYEYERAYRHDTATVRYRQYKPDFFLPDFDLYLEHFGVNRAGQTAPWIDRQKYQEDMAWKRDVHQRFGTRLLETYSWEHAEGVLFSALETKLRAAGVTPGALPSGEEFAGTDAASVLEPLVTLLATFLNLFKGNLWTLEELERAARRPATGSRHPADAERAVAFLRVFGQVHARYEAALDAAGEIDFNDMIALATERVTSGRFVSPWTHVIVDEFQDLSRGRARLLDALLAQVPGRRLFCVGDDWQSIFRFTGSDIEQMTAFGERFGFYHRCDLTRTHRFNTELLAASSTFVQRNPTQFRKALVAARSLGAPAIEVLAAQPDDLEGCLDRALTRIAAHAAREWKAPADAVPGAKPTVLLLGRYNFTKPVDWQQLTRRHPRLSLAFLTVHRSKGLEADYAVVLDVVAGRMGFPSEVVDDPVLDLVLAGTGGFRNAEERRLFYVALTRARSRCFVLTDAARRSRFVEEIEGEAYRAWVVPADGGAGTDVAPACPSCGGGRLMRRAGEYRAFWRCGNFPLCEGRARMCPACGEGALVRHGAGFRCHSPRCSHVTSLCPSCGQGALLSRQGRYGAFLGCSEWRPEGAGPSCNYRQSVGSGGLRGEGQRVPH
jgi:DNA helicase IV